MKFHTELKYVLLLFMIGLIVSCSCKNTQVEPMDLINDDVLRQKLNQQNNYLDNIKTQLDRAETLFKS